MIERIVIRGYRCFERLDLEPNPRLNIIVGDNQSGKSTLLEAISMALTGRINGRRLADELSPYWFHAPNVWRFFDNDPTPHNAPTISIDLYLTASVDDLHHMRGVHNSLDTDQPGISVSVIPNSDYESEFRRYLESNPPRLVPVEYYTVVWKDFCGNHLYRRPRWLNAAVIDSNTVRSSTGIDYYTRNILNDHLDESERTSISISHRKARQQITEQTLRPINERIRRGHPDLHDSLGLQMDQSPRASWEHSVIPQVADIPFAMAGQGQQAMIKIALAVNNSVGTSHIILIEEPENHLSHTSLGRLIGRVEKLSALDQQIFVTTHNSFVLNKLGLDALYLLGSDRKITRIQDLSEETANFFRKLPGFHTLRVALAQKVVLVEGPSDELIFRRHFRDEYGEEPINRGIDVIAMGGLTLKRTLELCKALDRNAAVLRDNDGKNPNEITSKLGSLVSDNRRVFVPPVEDGHTLESQLVSANDDARLRSVLGLDETTNIQEWMIKNKTDAALHIYQADEKIKYPEYIVRAAESQA